MSVGEASAWQKLKSTLKHLRTVVFSDDGSMIALGGSDGVVYILNASDGSIIKKLTGHRDVILGTAFTKDGRQVISVSADGVVNVWQIR